MKKIYFICCFYLLNYSAIGQCNYTLFPGYNKITSSQTITAANTWYWVCENVVLTIDSSAAGTFFLEQNSTIRFIKASYSCDVVYAKNGCTIINNSGGCVAIGANPNTVTITNTGTGSAVLSVTCASMNYDYSNVGGTACQSTVTGISEAGIKYAGEIVIFPNPVTVNSVLKIEGVQSEKVSLYDLNGSLIKISDSSIIELRDISPGFYFIRVRTKSGVQTRKIIIN